MFCEQCGTELSEGAKFCPNCGTKCAVVVSSETAPVENPPKTEEIKSEEVKIEEVKNEEVGRDAVKVEESEVTPTAEVEPLKKQEPKKKSVLPVILSVVGGLVVLGGGVLLWIFKPWVPKEEGNVSGNEVLVSETDDTEKALTDFEKENRTDIDIEEEDYSIYEGLSLYPYRSDALDVYGMFMNPAEKDASLSWDGSMYNYLEEVNPDSEEDGQLKNYLVEEKYYTGQGNGVREVCLIIYRHPETNIINKITCTEYHDGYEKILDFIYLDDGTLNYANFSYNEVSDPELKKFTDTYGFCFFSSDVMTQYLITQSQDTFANIKLVEISGENPGEYCYFDASESIQNSYDLAEKMYLNAGYNVLEAAEMDYSYGCMRGFVCDQYREAITGANIDIYVAGTNYLVGSLETDSDGYATGISWLEDGYDLVITKDGYVGTILYDVAISPKRCEVVNDTAILLKDAPTEAEVVISVYDDLDVTVSEDGTITTKEVTPDEVIVRRGKNNHTGKIYKILTAEDGIISTILPSGIYTFEISAKDYYTIYRTIELYGDMNITLPMSAKIAENQIKIVVSWQSDEDYDLSMFGNLSDGGSTCLTSGMGDDGNGATISYDGNGTLHSEVIVIDDYTKGNYRFYVSDYASVMDGNNGAGNMKLSNMIVYVYDASGLVAVYEVPYSDGPVWEVFHLNVGEIITSQRIYTDYTPNALWGHKYSMEQEVREALGYELIEGYYFDGVYYPYEDYSYMAYTGALGKYLQAAFFTDRSESQGVTWLNGLCDGEVSDYLNGSHTTYLGEFEIIDYQYMDETDVYELSYAVCGDESAMNTSSHDENGYLVNGFSYGSGDYIWDDDGLFAPGVKLLNPHIVYSDGIRCDVEFDTQIIDNSEFDNVGMILKTTGNPVKVHLIKDERSIFGGFRVTGAEVVVDPVEEVQDASVGDTVTFGEFEGTEIEWVVLEKEDGEALLLSKTDLYYCNEIYDYWEAIEDYNTSYCLNGPFIDLAFTYEEQQQILTTTIRRVGSWGDNENEYFKYEKVFLLSLEEWEEYDDVYDGTWPESMYLASLGMTEASYVDLDIKPTPVGFCLRSSTEPYRYDYKSDYDNASLNYWTELGGDSIIAKEDGTTDYPAVCLWLDGGVVGIRPAIRVRYE